MATSGGVDDASGATGIQRGLAELSSVRVELREQRQLIRTQLTALRSTHQRVGRELAACRASGEGLRLRLPGLTTAAAPEERSSHVEEAQELLLSVLAHGPVRTVEVQRRAQVAGISPRTLARARSRLRVRARRVGGLAGRGAWYCQLPQGDG
ncbi:MAG: hypothetical protein JWM18_275 [Chloroflexi bacterium]|nr:hypothetical protein [Chloroflexota bacterium]